MEAIRSISHNAIVESTMSVFHPRLRPIFSLPAPCFPLRFCYPLQHLRKLKILDFPNFFAPLPFLGIAKLPPPPTVPGCSTTTLASFSESSTEKSFLPEGENYANIISLQAEKPSVATRRTTAKFWLDNTIYCGTILPCYYIRDISPIYYHSLNTPRDWRCHRGQREHHH